MFMYPEHCPRGLTDCQPLAQLSADGSEESFVCCGRNDGTSRLVEQDCYRFCHKSAEGVDRMENCDRYDLLSHQHVISSALLMIELEQLDDS